jgi:hypothetical protein
MEDEENMSNNFLEHPRPQEGKNQDSTNTKDQVWIVSGTGTPAEEKEEERARKSLQT